MIFGWFSKAREGDDKLLAKARKLEAQGRWAEALSYFLEVQEQPPGSTEAVQGARSCRERLVDFNLEEAESYRSADGAKALEHARLALDLAGSEGDLRDRAWEVIQSLKVPEPPVATTLPKRLFEPTCSCAAPCGGDLQCEAEEQAGELDVEDLAAFYLESCQPAEREAFEPLGATFRDGFIHLQQGQYPEARTYLERAAIENPTAPGPTYALGLLAALEGNAAEAAQAFRKVLGLSPHFAPAAHHLADLLRETGHGEEAVAFLSTWLTTAPDDAEARVILALTLLQADQAVRAREEAERAQRLCETDDFRPGLILARALRAEGDGDSALRALQGILARKPETLEALVLLGQILLEQGGASSERAAETFKRCYRLDPERGWWYLVRVAQAYGVKGWKNEARAVLERACQELPDEPEARQTWESVRNSLENPG